MCRNIKTLFNYEPPATDAEIQAAALQYVRKISGSVHPSAANAAAFEAAVEAVAASSRNLLEQLVTRAPARNRERDAERARQRWQARSGR